MKTQPIFSLNRIILYVQDIAASVQFYEKFFGLKAEREEGDRIVELVSPAGGASLMLHGVGRGRKMGQSLVKIVFDVADVEAFCADAQKKGLDFGPIHQGDGYVFANARDPSKNPVSVSGRAFRIKG